VRYASIRAALKALLGPAVYRQLQVQRGRLTSRFGRERIHLGSLRRLTPVSSEWGEDRGLPIDRHYIEQFLQVHSGDIRGRVLEIRDDTYVRRFGGNRVSKIDVLYPVEGNPRATIVADLASAEHIPGDTFDCVVLTQTLQFIYDTQAVIRTLHRILKPGGILLATFPGISQSSQRTTRWPDYWRFTRLSSERLFSDCFPSPDIAVQAWGNVLTAIAFLHGLATEELRPEELDFRDPDYEVLITVRAVKPTGAQ
jgi:SAM-dependent methyltransferase